VAEADGMVWVHPDAQARSRPPQDAVPAAWHFCRTLTLDQPVAALPAALQAQGWHLQGGAWAHTGWHARALLLDAQPSLAMVHVWTAAAPGSPAMAALHLALRQLRAVAEAH
jgi:hypothetical protein